MLGDDPPEASLPGEVVPAADFYDYADKYEDGKAELRVPAPLSPEQTAEVQRARGARVRGVPGRGDGAGRLLPPRRRRLRRQRAQHDPRLHADLDVPAAVGGVRRAVRRAARPPHRPRDRPGAAPGRRAGAVSAQPGTDSPTDRSTMRPSYDARTPPEEAAVAVSAYILIQTEVGKASAVVDACRELAGVVQADDVTGPYDVILRAEAASIDELGPHGRVAGAARRRDHPHAHLPRRPPVATAFAGASRVLRARFTPRPDARAYPCTSMASTPASAPTANRKLLDWVERWTAILQPDRVHWCDGSDEEYERPVPAARRSPAPSRRSTRRSGRTASTPAAIPATSPGSRTARSSAASARSTPARPTTGGDPAEMRAEMLALFTGAMRGRTLYVVPFSMGPLGSPIAHIGVELTDSAYVAVSMRTMTRMGKGALDVLGADGEFVPCVHSVGMPLEPGQADVPWPCNNEHKYIVHFPETREIQSYGSGYGGNALLGKKCFALRIASRHGARRGLARRAHAHPQAHEPGGRGRASSPARSRARAARPTSRCSCRRCPGWKAETIGDDICWMKFGADGRLYAINPEYGMFGVAPGTGLDTNAERDRRAHAQHRLHQRRAHRRRRRVVGGPHRRAARALHRLEGQRLDARVRRCPPRTRTAASPRRSRRCRASRPSGRTRTGVPISAILFGGRRASTVPLVTEAYNWQHGVFLGSIMGSETTAAAAGAVGNLRRDPFAMLPFCGYNMGDYFAHWLSIGRAGRRRQAAEALLRQLVPQGRRRQVPLAGLRREQPRARVGVRPVRERRRRHATPRSAGCPTADALPTEGLAARAGCARRAARRSTTTSGAPSSR